MNPDSKQELFSVLQLINGKPVETFKNFPEFIRAGEVQLPKDDFDFLLAEGYLVVKKTDSFGKLLELSERGKEFLNIRR